MVQPPPKSNLLLRAINRERSSTSKKLEVQKPVSQVRILPGAQVFVQFSGGFQVPADWCWLVLVGALVGDGLASDDAPWLAIVNRATASSREAMSSRSVGNRPASRFSVVAADSWLDALNGTASLITMPNQGPSSVGSVSCVSCRHGWNLGS
jgi:hypothetical protein